MNDNSLTDFERSEDQLRWNLEQSIKAYDQQTVSGEVEPRRRLKMLDGVLSTALKLAKVLTRRAEFEQAHSLKPDWVNGIQIGEVTQMLSLVENKLAR